MRHLKAFILTGILALASMGAIYGLWNVYNSTKLQQAKADRTQVITSLINYQKMKNQLPTGKRLTSSTNSKVYNCLKKKKIKDRYLNDIYEIDLSALKLNLGTRDKFYMVKNQPFSAFCYLLTKQDDFKLDVESKIINLPTCCTAKKELVEGSKKMTKVDCSYKLTDNITLIGGSGDMVLGEYSANKFKEVSSDKLSNVIEVEKIVSGFVQCKKSDGSYIVYSFSDLGIGGV